LSGLWRRIGAAEPATQLEYDTRQSVDHKKGGASYLTPPLFVSVGRFYAAG
jgi:hypothetical protein